MFDISQGQLFILLVYSATVGAALGVVYDFFRIIRVAFPYNAQKNRHSTKVNRSKFIYGAIVFLQDVIFWIFAALVTILFTFMANRGQIRLFALSGQLVGFTIYYFTVGRLVYKLAGRLVRFIRQTLRLFKRHVINPIVIFMHRIYRKLTIKLSHKYLLGYTKREMKKTTIMAAKGFN